MDFDTIMIIIGVGIFFAVLFSPKVGTVLMMIIFFYALSLVIPITEAVETGNNADTYCASVGGEWALFHLEWDSAASYYPNYCELPDGSFVRVPGQ